MVSQSPSSSSWCVRHVQGCRKVAQTLFANLSIIRTAISTSSNPYRASARWLHPYGLILMSAAYLRPSATMRPVARLSAICTCASHHWQPRIWNKEIPHGALFVVRSLRLFHLSSRRLSFFAWDSSVIHRWLFQPFFDTSTHSIHRHAVLFDSITNSQVLSYVKTVGCFLELRSVDSPVVPWTNRARGYSSSDPILQNHKGDTSCWAEAPRTSISD